MKLGFFNMPMHPPGGDYTQGLDNDLEQIITVDRLGFQEAWLGEHITSEWENVPAPDLLIASALRETKDIILGTGVNCMPYHHPVMLAHRIAQLDHMAHGRFHWGVGAGALPADLGLFGFDMGSFGEVRGMMRAAVDMVLQLWNDPKPGLYEHKFWRFTIPEPDPEIGQRVHIQPYQKPHPPIAVAGVSPKSDTLVLAGERGWIPMSINIVPSRILKSHWEAVEEGAQQTGKKPDRSLWRLARNIFVAETTEEARHQALHGTLGRDYRDYFMKLLPKCNMPDADVTLEYLMDNVWIVGSPDEVTEKLQELHHDVGGFGVLLAMGHEWNPKEQWVKSITLLKNEVLPRLATGG